MSTNLVRMNSKPQRWIPFNVNTTITSSILTPVFQVNPELEKVFRDNYNTIKPLLQTEEIKKEIQRNPFYLETMLKRLFPLTSKQERLLLENRPLPPAASAAAAAPAPLMAPEPGKAGAAAAGAPAPLMAPEPGKAGAAAGAAVNAVEAGNATGTVNLAQLKSIDSNNLYVKE